MHNHKVSIGASLVVLLLSAVIAHACSIIYPTVRVGRAFRVRVMDRGRPVQSLRLMLSAYDSSNSGRKDIVYSLTDSEGYAHFANLNAGSFVVTADHDGGVVDGVVIDVRPDGAANVTVPLKWPNATPLQVRSLTGILRGPDYYPQQTQGQLSLSLLEGVSGRVIETTETDSKGGFSFAGAPVPSGIYFLQVNLSDLRARDGEPIEGMIPIEVNPKSAQEVLDVDLGWSSCGLGYAQRTTYPDLEVSKLCGDVADALGAVISNAQVMLLSKGENAEILEQTRSGTSGQFTLKEKDSGTYQLVVTSPGFQPFLRGMQMETSEASGDCKQPIRVRLKVE